jgi:S1-C subfamily serine protease
MGFIGAAISSIVALRSAFRRKTWPAISAAIAAALFFGFVCMLFAWSGSDPSHSALESAAKKATSSQKKSSEFDISSISKDKELARYLREQGERDVTYGRTHRPPGIGTPVPIPLIAEQVQRAVVQITDLSTSGQLVGNGTGFFVSASGHVLTCWHVVAPANVDHLHLRQIDGLEYEVRGVVGFSAKDDWVLLETARVGTDFLPIRSSRGDKPAAGTRILVFGNPGQLRGVWSEGSVSGFVFNFKGTARDSLRFDAPVAPGSSGSPVVDAEKGDVVGIASATGWPVGNFAVPFYYITDIVAGLVGSTPVAVAEFKAKLEKEKPMIKQQISDKERQGDFAEASQLCQEYSARYPGDVWGPWENAQISFALNDYNAAGFYMAWLQPARDPGDDILCAMKFECADLFSWWPGQRDVRRGFAELLKNDYGVEICGVQIPPNLPVRVLNVRERPDAKSKVLYEFDADEHVFAKSDRVRNDGGKENVIWRKVLILPSHDSIHGGEGWVNERYICASAAVVK